jgi:hypothetical protein
MRDGDLLRRAAERAGHHPFYLASSLLAYARAERLDDAALAASLGCDLDTLPTLLLCRRPTGSGAVFRADVEAIAARFGIEAARLAALIRAADALVSLRDAPADQPNGLLAAARDREPGGDRKRAEDERQPNDAPRSDAEPGEGAP